MPVTDLRRARALPAERNHSNGDRHPTVSPPTVDPIRHRRCDRLHSARWRADARSLVHRRGKGHLAGLLAEAGIGLLDAGFPGASGADLEAMQEMRQAGVTARLGATARPLRVDIAAAAKAQADDVSCSCPPVTADCGKPLAPPVIRPRISCAPGRRGTRRGHWRSTWCSRTPPGRTRRT